MAFRIQAGDWGQTGSWTVTKNSILIHEKCHRSGTVYQTSSREKHMKVNTVPWDSCPITLTFSVFQYVHKGTGWFVVCGNSSLSKFVGQSSFSNRLEESLWMSLSQTAPFLAVIPRVVLIKNMNQLIDHFCIFHSRSWSCGTGKITIFARSRQAMLFSFTPRGRWFCLTNCLYVQTVRIFFLGPFHYSVCLHWFLNGIPAHVLKKK